jgi:CHAT domain-containing protein
VLESLRADLGQSERGRFFADKLIAYDQLIVFLAQMERLQPGNGYGLSAFSVLERKEARAVLEQVASRSATRFRGVSPELLSEDQATKALVESAEATVERLSAGNAEPAEVAKARKDLADAVTGRELFETRLKTESPDYYALLHPKPVALDELRAVIGPNAAMLAYDVHDNLSVLFVVTRDLFKMLILPGAEALGHRTAVARSHIDKMLNAQRIAAASQIPIDLASQASRDLPGFQSDSYALYRELIPASVAAVLGRKSLIITPSGPLYDFPWEALVTKHEGAVTRYLLQDHAVSYVPSGSLLELVRTGERHAPNREPLLAFARPAFGSPAREGGPSNSKAVDEQSEYDALVKATGWSFPDLPGTKAEADAVAAILHADLHESVLTGDAASREKLLSLNATQQLMRYRYILFATHAVLQGTSVLRPALVLAHPATDGLVTIDDILGLSLDADLVDLSACNTGAGTRPSGDGINGLTRAFLYAGAPVISVALWDVDDRAAEAMAPKFFAAMSAGDGPAEALHRAKLTMLASNDARLRHPYAWAPSVVFGDGEPQRR